MFKKNLILATVLGGVIAITTAKYLKEKIKSQGESEDIIGYRISVEKSTDNSITYKEVESYDIESLPKAVEEAIKEGYIADFEFITESGSYDNVDSVLIYEDEDTPSHLHFYHENDEDLVIEAHIRA